VAIPARHFFRRATRSKARFETLWNEPEFLSDLELLESFETPVTIAVLADTHFGERLRPLPPPVVEALRKSDLILHAGDFCSVEAYEMIAGLGELRGVFGNNDALPLVRTLPSMRSFRFGRFTAAIINPIVSGAAERSCSILVHPLNAAGNLVTRLA
jgi:hypothetical protein